LGRRGDSWGGERKRATFGDDFNVVAARVAFGEKFNSSLSEGRMGGEE
jgi:hypothetical protein